jgi:hypothetical protein
MRSLLTWACLTVLLVPACGEDEDDVFESLCSQLAGCGNGSGAPSSDAASVDLGQNGGGSADDQCVQALKQQADAFTDKACRDSYISYMTCLDDNFTCDFTGAQCVDQATGFVDCI